jgi:carbonic anhydrase
MRTFARLALTLCALVAVPARAADVQTAASQAVMTPTEALERLRKGNERFAANATKPYDWSAKVVATASGQHPFAAVLGCMDSRAPIEIVFDQGIGNLFGVRIAGNVVNEDELGSLEYAAKVGVKLLVVLGHTRCGAVKGALDDVKLGNLSGVLAKIRPAVTAARCSDSRDDACVTKVAEENVRESMRQVRDRSAHLASALDAGELKLVGAMYDVATGRVTFLEP